MAKSTQTYATHARFMPMWHYFVFPILGINVIVALVATIRHFSSSALWWLVVSLALVLTALSSRLMALKAQDRLIRLEESLRLARILPDDLRAAGAGISADLLIGLRFASDAEVPDLVRRIAKGELTTQAQVKKAIGTWRPDTYRV